MIKKCVRFVSCCALLVVQTGCATIVSDKAYPVTFISEPPGAKVEVKDQNGVTKFMGVTPATATLDAGNGYFTRARYTVTTSKDGYTPSVQQVSSSLNGWYWGNILVGGLIGMLIVDPISGAMYEIDNPSLTFNMSRSNDLALTSTSLRSTAEAAEQLLRLRKLREEGVLTEGEYQTKKKALVKEM